ncbi:hypothetical protein, partial [Streptomyces sp. NPDC059900]|uniref:hypothetical protein n=1 Tax=Streptomyces sp. NPDC059900 TaxID=3155816 RepID=UPI003CFFC474
MADKLTANIYTSLAGMHDTLIASGATPKARRPRKRHRGATDWDGVGMGERTSSWPIAEGTTDTRHHERLQLPDFDTLSVAQTCGRACVWCADDLSAESAVELGKRSVRGFETNFVWFPRACRLCAVLHAYRALLDHAQRCI